MNQTVNANRLFLASCFALITTSMAFGIRAGVLTQLGVSFQLDNEQLGYVNQMAFLGFPIAMIIGGPLYNVLGPKKIIWVAFFSDTMGTRELSTVADLQVKQLLQDVVWDMLVLSLVVQMIQLKLR